MLRRLAHWLMKEPDLEEEYLRADADRTGITVERRSMKDEIGAAKVTTPTGKSQDVTLEKVGPAYGAANSMRPSRGCTRSRWTG